MRLLLVRHAIAVERAGSLLKSDAERPLTRKGERRMRKAARGLASLVPALDRIVSSPLVRAIETAVILAEARPGYPAPEVNPVLSPGHGPGEVVRWLTTLGRAAAVAAVGHEPGMSTLLAHLLGGDDPAAVAFGKGGAALLDLESDTRKGTVTRATLVFFAPPKLLRQVR